jgi:hypothetical protein
MDSTVTCDDIQTRPDVRRALFKTRWRQIAVTGVFRGDGADVYTQAYSLALDDKVRAWSRTLVNGCFRPIMVEPPGPSMTIVQEGQKRSCLRRSVSCEQQDLAYEETVFLLEVE